jgi:hypothetical protein
LLGDGYSALAALNAPRLREAAAALAASMATQLDHDGDTPAQTATTRLNWAAFLIDGILFDLRS